MHPVTRFPFLRAGCARLAMAVGLVAGSAGLVHAACSCTAMTVHHANGGHVDICSNANLKEFVDKNECTRDAGSVGNGCAGYTYRYQCLTGVNTQHLDDPSPYQHTGFGIDATITGTANECTSGQTLQQTITGRDAGNSPVQATPTGNVTVGTLSVTIKSGSGRMPDVGATVSGTPEFGADDYTNVAATDVLIASNNGRIQWWDNPDETKDRRNESATWQLRYFSYVLGSGGGTSCGCIFNIKVNWDRLKSPTTTYEPDLASPPCTF